MEASEYSVRLGYVTGMFNWLHSYVSDPPYTAAS